MLCFVLFYKDEKDGRKKQSFPKGNLQFLRLVNVCKESNEVEEKYGERPSIQILDRKARENST